MSSVCPALVESKPRDVSSPSEISRTALGPFQLESNFFNASITSTYGLKDDAEVLAKGIRSEFAARFKSVVNGWRTCRLPAVIYPTNTREPAGSERMKSRVTPSSL